MLWEWELFEPVQWYHYIEVEVVVEALRNQDVRLPLRLYVGNADLDSFWKKQARSTKLDLERYRHHNAQR